MENPNEKKYEGNDELLEDLLDSECSCEDVFEAFLYEYGELEALEEALFNGTRLISTNGMVGTVSNF